MKKFIGGFVLGVALLFGAGVLAATQFNAQIADFPVYVNGSLFQAKTGHILEVDGRTYLPVRDMADASGTPINWNEELGRVEVGYDTSKLNETRIIVIRLEIEKGIELGYIDATKLAFNIDADEGVIAYAKVLANSDFSEFKGDLEKHEFMQTLKQLCELSFTV